jgi:hypothetical protein
MNAHVPIPVDAAAIEARFADLCDNRVALYIEGALTLQEAVDECHGYAVLSGLIDRIGQDQAQHVMAVAFAATDSQFCENCDRTIDRHYRVDTEFFCDDLEAMIYRRAIELERAFWHAVDNPDHLAGFLADHPFDAPALYELWERKHVVA